MSNHSQAGFTLQPIKNFLIFLLPLTFLTISSVALPNQNGFSVKINLNIFIKFIGWPWLIKLCSFQAYNSTTHHLYIVLSVHHPKSSLLPLPFTTPLSPSPTSPYFPVPLGITKLLSVSMSFLGFLFISHFLFLLNPFTFFIHAPVYLLTPGVRTENPKRPPQLLSYELSGFIWAPFFGTRSRNQSGSVWVWLGNWTESRSIVGPA